MIEQRNGWVIESVEVFHFPFGRGYAVVDPADRSSIGTFRTLVSAHYWADRRRPEELR